MNKRIKSILRCYAAGMGIKETASTFHTSRNTVRKYVRLFLSSGKSIEQFLSLSNEQLHEMFGCTESRHRDSSSRQIELKALLPGYVSRLTQKGTSVRKLFKEYHAEYPEDYQLSSFKRAVRQYKFHIKVVGHVEHYAADQMYIDFAGDRLEVVDEMTGETKKAEVFVAVLPFSHYTYCEAVWSQRKEDLIRGCENAMQYFEGVPAAIVPDNLKAAVIRSDRNEPVINDDFAAFAEHYGCAVYPARVRHPKDKALVENAVKLLYRSIYLDMEGMTFSSLEDLNTAIRISLLDFNEKVMAGREMSRKKMFLQGEKEYSVELKSSDSGNMVRMENRLNALDKAVEDVQKEIKTCENEIKNAKQEYAKPFPYEELLKENITRQMEIDAELEIKDQEECVEVQEETKNLPCQTAVR